MTERETSNVLGAIVFFAYIAAALFFTGFITRDLIRLYNQSLDVRTLKDRSVAEVGKQREKAQVFVALSLISFSVLSYQMLTFLIQSYSRWSAASDIALPTSILGQGGLFDIERRQSSLYAWKWSTQSRLFQDFAETIVNDPRRFWWTQQVLLYSLGWNIYMAVEGVRYRVPHLWAYFVLDQILPVSFTQNLFCTAIFLTHKLPQAANLRAAPPGDQFIVVFVYLFCLSIAPDTIGLPYFLFIIFTIRALLFAPLWIMKPSITIQPSPARGSPESLYWHYRYSALVLAVGGVFLHVRQTKTALPIVEVVEALRRDPAVAALGYDYIIGFISLLVLLYSHRS